MSSTCKICDMEVRERVRVDRKCEHSETCSPVERCWKESYSWGQGQTDTRSAQIVAETCTTDWNVVQLLSQSSKDTAIVSKKSSRYSAFTTTGLWNTTTSLWVVACKGKGQPRTLYVTFFSDKAWFHLTDYMNSHNTHRQSTKSPHTVHKTFLSILECGKQCLAVERFCAFFFERTFNSGRYTDIDLELLGHLNEEEIADTVFQQDCTKCHAARATMGEAFLFFGDWIISKRLHSLHSPDLSAFFFCAWGYSKTIPSAVWMNWRPATLPTF
jgi:hypothetical protein